MHLYSVDLKLVATAYIKASSEAEARKIAEGLERLSLELPEGVAGDLSICGREFDDPDLPAVSLSPAVTIEGTVSRAIVGLAAEDVPEPHQDDPSASDLLTVAAVDVRPRDQIQWPDETTQSVVDTVERVSPMSVKLICDDGVAYTFTGAMDVNVRRPR